MWWWLLLGLMTVLCALRVYNRVTAGWCRCTTRMDGKVVIVTGANSGIGKETARDLAARGARVIMACRDLQKADEARADIVSSTGNTDVAVRRLDLLSFESVRAFVRVVLQTETRLDVLVNNAGVAGYLTKYSEDGLNMIMQANHFGPFLLTCLLIVLSYFNSKLCNVYMTQYLAEKLQGTGVSANCLHPGFVGSNLFRYFPTDIYARSISFLIRCIFKSPASGAQTSIHLAVSAEGGRVSGKYFSDLKQQPYVRHATFPSMAKKVWERSAEIVKLSDRVVAGVIACLLTGAAVGAGVFYALNQTQAKCASPPAPAEPCPVPRATIDSGRLRGICRPAMQGRPQYAAFLGIPYAKPPLGELRFKAPRPVERWDGVREATLLGQECIQGSVDRQKGSEDCLVLNVYSPRLPQPLTQTQAHPPLPVLVHVHGGSMVEGSGNMIRPDYFVAQDLVVVTFNYRLGRFGFLNLDNDLAPGNAALKDMIAALKWINRNIQHFGGDPKQVTIQGCSSAAACVHWLTLLPETEDLFRGAIIKSGSALESWAYTEQHRGLSDGALAFFKKWPFSQNLTASQILHNMGTLALDLAFTYAEAHRVKNSPENVMPISVSTEKHRQKTLNEPKLVVRDPESYLLVPDRTPVPILMGVTNCEYVPIAEMNFMLDQLPAVNSTDFELMVPRSLIPMGDTMKALNIDAHSYGLNFSNAADDLRAVMFNLTAVDPNCDLECRWEQYVSDTRMSVDSIRSIRMHARNKKQPVYAYFYEYPLAGSCAYHATDDALVWVQDVDRLMQLNTTHPLALNVMRQVALFSNFAKHGKPVLETDAEVLTTEWPPMNEKGPDVFLRIGVNLTVDHSDMMGKFGSFWKTEYAKYREGKGI